jgi:hypothetical protein
VAERLRWAYLRYGRAQADAYDGRSTWRSGWPREPANPIGRGATPSARVGSGHGGQRDVESGRYLYAHRGILGRAIWMDTYMNRDPVFTPACRVQAAVSVCRGETSQTSEISRARRCWRPSSPVAVSPISLGGGCMTVGCPRISLSRANASHLARTPWHRDLPNRI